MGDPSPLPYSLPLSASESNIDSPPAPLQGNTAPSVIEVTDLFSNSLGHPSSPTSPDSPVSLTLDHPKQSFSHLDDDPNSHSQSSAVDSFKKLSPASTCTEAGLSTSSSLPYLCITTDMQTYNADRSKQVSRCSSLSKSESSQTGGAKESLHGSNEPSLTIAALKKKYPSLSKLNVVSHPEGSEPKDSGQTEDIYEIACHKIQNWWRIKQLKRHFHAIKHRASSSVNGSMNLLKPSHSRKGSEDYPLKHINSEYVQKFNEDPVRAVRDMLAKPLATVSDPHEVVATFLVLNEQKLDRNKLGDLFGQPDTIFQEILRSYMSSINLKGISQFEAAIRLVLSKFRLPGEAQKIMRILETFANQFCFENPTVFRSATTAFVLAFSLIMLNTDAHNPAVKKKMTLPEFIKNNRGIDDGKDLPESLLRRIFFEIKCCPIKMLDNDDSLQRVSGLDEFSKSKLVGEFSAWKAIKNTKHPRHLFLFKDRLLVTKIRPGPKYILNHLFDLGNLKLEKTWGRRSNESSEYLSASNLITLTTIFPRPEHGESEKEPADSIVLGFDYLEELALFLELSFRQKQELEEERRLFQASLPTFVANRVSITKTQIEGSPTRRYTASPGSLRATRLSLQKTASHVNQSIKQGKQLIPNATTAPRPASSQGYFTSLPKRLSSFIGALPNSNDHSSGDP